MVSLSSFFILILFGLFRQIFNNIFKKSENWTETMTNVIKEFFCLSNGSSRACSKPVIPFKYKNNNSGQITSLFLYLPPSPSLSLAGEDGEDKCEQGPMS